MATAARRDVWTGVRINHTEGEQMGKRFFGAAVVAVAVSCTAAIPAQASDAGNAPPTLSFYSGGSGASAHWQNDPNDSPNDDNTQDIKITTTVPPSGYAGVTVHHVAGIPAEAYPNSSFEVKADGVAPAGMPSMGSPRLVVQFSDGGNAQLRPLAVTPDWQKVQDPNWDDNGGTCGYRYETSWQDVQGCHAGAVVTNVYIATDPLGLTYYIDNLETAGKVFNEAADNGGTTGQ